MTRTTAPLSGWPPVGSGKARAALMACRRIGAREVPELREAFAERPRARRADFAERLGGLVRAGALAALDAGERVGVQGWELRGLVGLPLGSAMRSFVLERDGTLTPE